MQEYHVHLECVSTYVDIIIATLQVTKAKLMSQCRAADAYLTRELRST